MIRVRQRKHIATKVALIIERLESLNVKATLSGIGEYFLSFRTEPNQENFGAALLHIYEMSDDIEAVYAMSHEDKILGFTIQFTKEGWQDQE